MYNYAIARSNPELIVSAVIILFITEIDEKLHDLLVALCPNWIEGLHTNLVRKDSAQENNVLDQEDFRSEDKTYDEPKNEEVSTFNARLLQMHDEISFKFEQIDLELRHLRSQPSFHEKDQL